MSLHTEPSRVMPLSQEAWPSTHNPLGLEGLEFLEYSTSNPQALGHVLELAGFRPVARHRSREVLLYRQGDMNVVINAHGVTANSAPAISAVALRVRDAQAAFTRCVSLGAWPVEATARPMELNIPGIHGVGASKVFFVDRWRDFSIYDVDFVSIPTVASQVESVAALHWFGAVQYVGAQRAAHWEAFYVALFGFVPVPAQQQFGILPKGSILASPCGSLYWQLIEPDADHVGDTTEALARVALRTPDVPRAVAHLRKLGLDFVETDQLHTEQRGAISQAYLGGVMFELVSQQ